MWVCSEALLRDARTETHWHFGANGYVAGAVEGDDVEGSLGIRVRPDGGGVINEVQMHRASTDPEPGNDLHDSRTSDETIASLFLLASARL